MAQKIKTPTGVQLPAGEIRDNESVAASEEVNSTLSGFNKRKTQHGNLPPGAGLVGSVWIVGDLMISVNFHSTNPAKQKALALEQLQLAMGAATALDSDAHLCSPARRVDEKPSLRRKQARTTTRVYRVHANLLVEVARG